MCAQEKHLNMDMHLSISLQNMCKIMPHLVARSIRNVSLAIYAKISSISINYHDGIIVSVVCTLKKAHCMSHRQ